MPATYEPIATTTLGSATASITFSTIPATYTDLRIVFVGKSAAGGSAVENFGVQFNSDTGTNYSRTRLSGDGSAAASARGTNNVALIFTEALAGSTATSPSYVAFDVFSYAGSTNKTVLAESSLDQNGSGTVARNVGLWRSTAAITTIKVYDYGGNNLAIGTTATLYGIKNA
jgi:hypothetical protein